MNTFIISIGFSELTGQKEIENLVLKVISNTTDIQRYKGKDGIDIVEYTLASSSSCGIKVRGEEDEDKKFHYTYYCPYLKAATESREDEIYINKKIDSDAYTGMCDDFRVGISLIFYIQNAIEYLNSYGEVKTINNKSVRFAGLSSSGKIILPTLSYINEKEKIKKEAGKKGKLMADAKKGNMQAIETLTMKEIDNYAKMTQRIMKEDMLSIVDTSIVPCGSESEMYNITGNILAATSENNAFTGEKIWILQLECNGIDIDVCINEKDLIGEPAAGRRFRGTVWLQGQLEV